MIASSTMSQNWPYKTNPSTGLPPLAPRPLSDFSLGNDAATLNLDESPAPKIHSGASTFDLAWFLRNTSPPSAKAKDGLLSRSNSLKSSPLSFFKPSRLSSKPARPARPVSPPPPQMQLPDSVVTRTAKNGMKYMHIVMPSPVAEERQTWSDRRRLPGPRAKTNQQNHDQHHPPHGTGSDPLEHHEYTGVEFRVKKPSNDRHPRVYRSIPQMSPNNTKLSDARPRRHRPEKRRSAEEQERKQQRLGRLFISEEDEPRSRDKAAVQDADSVDERRPTPPPKGGFVNHYDQNGRISATSAVRHSREASCPSPSQAEFSPTTAKQRGGSPPVLRFKQPGDTSSFHPSSGQPSLERAEILTAERVVPAMATSSNGHAIQSHISAEPRLVRKSKPPSPGPAPTKALPSLPEGLSASLRSRASTEPPRSNESNDDAVTCRIDGAIRILGCGGGIAGAGIPIRGPSPFTSPATTLDGMAETAAGADMANAACKDEEGCVHAQKMRDIHGICGPYKEAGVNEPTPESGKADAAPVQEEPSGKRNSGTSQRPSVAMKRLSKISATERSKLAKRMSAPAVATRQTIDPGETKPKPAAAEQDPGKGAEKASTEKGVDQAGFDEADGLDDLKQADWPSPPNVVLPSSDDEYGRKSPLRKSSKTAASGGSNSARSSRTATSKTCASGRPGSGRWSRTTTEVEARLDSLERRNVLLEATLVALLKAPPRWSTSEAVNGMNGTLSELRGSSDNERLATKRPSSLEELISSLPPRTGRNSI
ncbi:MAG: hypothetical protein M1837_002327 [Sclerophora amabilis]|nr:MAG: hypothetical protein M1837_002327 [Sclerophora amabilis]